MKTNLLKTNNYWDTLLEEEMEKEYFQKLLLFLKEEYKKKTIFPEYQNILNSLKLTDYNEVKVMILGQDPYHGVGEAHGLSFSVMNNQKRPPSLNNIFKELKSDLEIIRVDNNLTDWATKGVLLLNAILTVEKDKPLAHKNKGWEIFTNKIIELLNEREKTVIFVLWGNYAKSKKPLITNKKHIIIEGVHPSPLSASRGFFGSKPFSKINKHLQSINNNPIKW
ncbi:MAG: uracil-DNA glycosylase [Bacilli bacterium]